jgi:pimeloyl-ACP methyl ester carboxylesterase
VSVTRVARTLEELPGRFLGSVNGARGRYRLNIGGLTRDVVVGSKTCEVIDATGPADVEICTDETTWGAMFEGRVSGIEAFADRRLTIRGSIDRSLHFEPLFDRPDAGGLRYLLTDVHVRNARISALIAGPEGAQPLFLFHGLGATKASWLTIVPGLAERYRVIVVDLPGFGASSKPLGTYDPPWFARYGNELLDEFGYRSALIAGNSMGGRIAMEMAMTSPHRVDAIACLCPAAAFSHRPAVMIARLLRPELGLFAGRLPRNRVREGLRQLFADASCIEEDWYDAAIDDFLKVWRSPRARIAFARSLRNIYLDEPHGEKGFWSRLAAMKTPALYVYGRRDVLITHRFGQKIRKTIPHAEVAVWNDCGHVPQIEFPDRTIETMTRFFDEAAPSAQEAV